jgi:prepilin-type N-terminal cleavage/methylation domain-containing protein
MKGNKGFAFIETVVALALLGIVAVFFLSSISTATKATIVNDEQATAECLVRSEVEYIKAILISIRRRDTR